MGNTAKKLKRDLQLWIQTQKQNIQKHPLKVMFAVAAVLSLLAYSSDKPKTTAPTETLLYDQFLSKQQSLIPIELTNHEALSAFLGSYGYVDLYLPKLGRVPSKLIAQGMKLVRSPQDPEVFSIVTDLVNMKHITEHAGPFFAVIRSAKTDHTSFPKKKFKTKFKRRKIILEED